MDSEKKEDNKSVTPIMVEIKNPVGDSDHILNSYGNACVQLYNLLKSLTDYSANQIKTAQKKGKILKFVKVRTEEDKLLHTRQLFTVNVDENTKHLYSIDILHNGMPTLTSTDTKSVDKKTYVDWKIRNRTIWRKSDWVKKLYTSRKWEHTDSEIETLKDMSPYELVKMQLFKRGWLLEDRTDLSKGFSWMLEVKSRQEFVKKNDLNKTK
jgi:hypothetical protein